MHSHKLDGQVLNARLLELWPVTGDCSIPVLLHCGHTHEGKRCVCADEQAIQLKRAAATALTHAPSASTACGACCRSRRAAVCRQDGRHAVQQQNRFESQLQFTTAVLTWEGQLPVQLHPAISDLLHPARKWEAGGQLGDIVSGRPNSSRRRPAGAMLPIAAGQRQPLPPALHKTWPKSSQMACKQAGEELAGLQ